jgi:hypothetical protein
MCSYNSACLMHIFSHRDIQVSILPVPWFVLIFSLLDAWLNVAVYSGGNLTIYSSIWLLARSRWPRKSKACVCGRMFVGIAGSNLARAWISVVSVCVLSGRGLWFVGLITRPEESYLVWCVWVWSWSSYIKETLAHWGLLWPTGGCCGPLGAVVAHWGLLWPTGDCCGPLGLLRHGKRKMWLCVAPPILKCGCV